MAVVPRHLYVNLLVVLVLTEYRGDIVIKAWEPGFRELFD